VRLGGTSPPVSLPACGPGERLSIARLIRSLILSPRRARIGIFTLFLVLVRTVDVILAFPQVVFALLLLNLLGPKVWLIVLAVGFSHAPQVARVLRSATLDISERDYVKAAELQGMRSARVMLKEILPNLSSPLTVEVGLRLTYSIVEWPDSRSWDSGSNRPHPTGDT
jgi:ABC-type antimicrobial peptide transport system permease subunit